MKMHFEGDFIVSVEELYNDYAVSVRREFYPDPDSFDNSIDFQRFTFTSKENTSFFDIISSSNQSCQVVTEAGRIEILSYTETLLLLKDWLERNKSPLQDVRNFTEFEIQKLRKLLSEFDEYAQLSNIDYKKIRVISYHNHDHFFEMVPVEKGSNKTHRHSISFTGSDIKATRNFENSYKAMNNWLQEIKKNVENNPSIQKEFLENKEILQGIQKKKSILVTESSEKKIMDFNGRNKLPKIGKKSPIYIFTLILIFGFGFTIGMLKYPGSIVLIEEWDERNLWLTAIGLAIPMTWFLAHWYYRPK